MDLKKTEVGTFVALALALSILAPSGVWAAFLSIDDTAPNETITIVANDFENGLYVNGILIQQGLNNPQSVTIPEAGPVTINGVWIAEVQSAQGSRTIYLVEPGNPTLISDILWYSLSDDGGVGILVGINATFTSDVNNNLGPLPPDVNPADVFVENGLPVDFSLPFLHLQALMVSDVPEPSTLLLLGLGMAGLGGIAWRRRKS